MSGVIDDYVAALRRELDFDPALARRLASEVEDHLRDAAEADPAWPSPEAERRAVERFGLGREIAAQFAVDAVDRQARRTWIVLAVTVVVTFVAMRLRVIWLDDGTSLDAGAADRPLCLHRRARGGRDRLVRLPPIAGRARDLPGRPRGVDRRRHRARRLVRQRRADPRPAVGGRRDRPDRRAVVPCRRIGPAPQAHGHRCGGPAWRMAQ